MQQKSILVCFMLSVAMHISAQNNLTNTASTIFTWFDPTDLQLDSSGKASVHVGGESLIGSSSQPVSFTDKLLFGGYITNEEKDVVRENLKDKNYGGFDFNTDFYVSIRTDSVAKNSAIILGGGYNYFQSLAYTRDFFNIAFYGNKLYEGDTAKFTGSAFNGYTLIAYKAGFVKQWNTKKGKFIAGFTGGYLQGLSARDAKINQGILYTAPDGQYLDITLDFEYNNTGTEPESFDAVKGNGYSFDFFTKYIDSESNFEISGYIHNLGRVHWTETPFNYITDTSYVFEGVDISYVFNASGTNADGSADSVFDVLGMDTTNLPFYTATPAKFNIAFTKYFTGQNISLNAGAQYYLYTPYQLFLYSRIGKYLPKPDMHIAAVLNVGGFGGFGFGLDIEKHFTDRFTLRIGSNSVLGFIAPDYFNTASIFASITTRF